MAEGISNINIVFPNGSKITVPVTSNARLTQELMTSDQIELSWVQTEHIIIPAGSYISYDGQRYTLLEPYQPEHTDEVYLRYEPKFVAEQFTWAKYPFFLYTVQTTSAGKEYTLREPSWTLTDEPQNFMALVVDAIKRETGNTWTFETVEEGYEKGTATLTFDNSDILSALNSIADAFGSEWWVDKLKKKIYLKTALTLFEGEPYLALEVGKNVGMPSVQNNKEEAYFNRYVVFGSTRNVLQDTQLASSNTIVNRRLTLDPVKYPEGYIDAEKNPAHVYTKVLYYDDIYPHADLTVSNVLCHTKESEREKGDTYNVYYFRLLDSKGKDIAFDATTYDKEKNPKGNLIPGLTLSINFKSGSLRGREFEMEYLTSPRPCYNVDGSSFTVPKGYFSVLFIEENGFVIPSAGIAPKAGDEAILFNCRMPDDYVTVAQNELEKAALRDIANYEQDCNSYTVESYKNWWRLNGTTLQIGSAVSLDKTLRGTLLTRVIKIERALDAPYDQSITVGNDRIKGAISTLREQMEMANNALDEVTTVARSARHSAQSLPRRFSDAKETMTAIADAMLDGFTDKVSPITVQTMQMLVGDESLQFRFLQNITSQTEITPDIRWADGQLTIPSCAVEHMTYGVTTLTADTSSQRRRWLIASTYSSGALTDKDKVYYLYVRAVDYTPSSTVKYGNATFLLSEEAHKMKENYDKDGTLYFLCGVLSSEKDDGNRSFGSMYGYSEITPGRMTLKRIQSNDGNTYFDLVKGEIGGNINFTLTEKQKQDIASSVDSKTKTLIDSAIGGIDVGGANLLINSKAERTVAYPATNYNQYNVTTVSTARMAKTVQDFDVVFQYKVNGWTYSYPPVNIVVLAGKKGGDAWSLRITQWRYKQKSSNTRIYYGTITVTAESSNFCNIYDQGIIKLICQPTIGTSRTDLPTAKVYELMLSYGNRLTDWEPAVEDVDASIDTAQSTATNAQSLANTAKTNAQTAQATADTAKTNAQTAQATADTAKANAKTAQDTADKAKTDATTAIANAKTANDAIAGINKQLTNFASDKIISPVEKRALLNQLNDIKAEFTQISNDADKYSISKTSFTTAKNNAVTALEYYTKSMTTDTDVATSGTYNYAYIAQYYTARTSILNEIATSAKKVATDAQSTANTAKTNAANAQTAANNAKSAADAAQATADSAKSLAASGRGNNLWPDPYFINASLTGLSISNCASPLVGNAIVCGARNHVTAYSIPLDASHTYRIEFTAVRIKGSLNIRASFWWNTGIPYNGYNRYTPERLGTVCTDANGNTWDRYVVRKISVMNSATAGKLYFLLEQTEGSFTTTWYVTDVAVYDNTMEQRADDLQYLRNAMISASQSSTDISGGLVLTQMLGVRDSSSQLKAYLNGNASDNRPMIASGVTSALPSGTFNVDDDGVVRSTDGTNTLTMEDSKISFSQGGTVMNTITSESGDSITGMLGKMSSSSTPVSVPQQSSSKSKKELQTNTLEVSLGNGYSSNTNTKTYTLVSSVAGQGKIKLPQLSITYRGHLDVVTGGKQLSGGSGNIKRTSFMTHIKVSLVRSSSGTSVLYNKEFGVSNETRMGYSDSEQSATVNAQEFSVVKGESVKLEVTSEYYGSLFIYNYDSKQDNLFISSYFAEAYCTVSSFKYTQSLEYYQNKTFADAIILSSASDRYFAIDPYVRDKKRLFQMQNGDWAYALDKNGGLLQRGLNNVWYRANPLVLVLKVVFTNNQYTATALYDPLNLGAKISENQEGFQCKRKNVGLVQVYHHLGHLNYAVTGNAYDNTWNNNENLGYISMKHNNYNYCVVQISDDATGNDHPFNLYLYDFRTF